MKSWHTEYQVTAKDREKTQLEYEIKRDLEELEAGKAQENAYYVRLKYPIQYNVTQLDIKTVFLFLIIFYNNHLFYSQTRKQEEINERRRRALANAMKQQRAAQWIKDNIIANQVCYN